MSNQKLILKIRIGVLCKLVYKFNWYTKFLFTNLSGFKLITD